MRRALWLNDRNHAVKPHLQFTVLRQAPGDALITSGGSCERKALRQFMKKGGMIVGNHRRDHPLLSRSVFTGYRL